MPKLAIIGAGISGATVAHQCASHFDIHVFEKARGVGGRMANRRSPQGGHFDMGAQFFTAKRKAFQSFLTPFVQKGVVQHWPARFAEIEGTQVASERQWSKEFLHYIALPTMPSLCKEILKTHKISLQTQIQSIVKHNGKWQLVDTDGQIYDDFDWVILSAPCHQTAALLPEGCEFKQSILSKKMSGCFTLMLAFSKPIDTTFDAALIRESDLSWISVNSSKAQRGELFSLVVHSTNAWAERHIEDELQNIQSHMQKCLQDIIPFDEKNIVSQDIHRWRYANIGHQAGPSYYLDTHQQIAACGDWCIRGFVEGAFDSANDLSQALCAL